MKIVILVSVIFTFHFVSKSQNMGDSLNPLMRFMQNNFDTTIIYSSYSTWDLAPNYIILAKVNGSIFSYTYRDQYKRSVLQKQIDSLAHLFVEWKMKFKTTVPDINEYLFPVSVNSSQDKIFWKELIDADMWQWKDDSSDFKKCMSFEAMDSDYNNFYLLTKTGNKQLHFYDIVNIAKSCPGNADRLKAITIMKLFKNFLDD